MTPPPQLRRRTTCRRHPTKPITGFCASCLRERLAGIDPDTHQELPAAAIDLRRSKSCRSSSAAAASSSSTVPRRKSCDVRPDHGNNSTLSDLFTKEAQGQSGNLREEKVGISLEGDVELRPIREFIDLEWGRKKVPSGRGVNGVASSLIGVASGFSRKLRRWGKKQMMRMPVGETSEEGGRSRVGRVGFRGNLSEVGEYGLGRRSCDYDPRLSVDAGRLSLDGGRCSFDEPRASWDGVLVGRTCTRFSPMVSVAEDVGVRLGSVGEERDLASLEDGEKNPGGSDQTRDYYGQLMVSQRRRSFDRSVPNRRIGLIEVDEFKSVSNAKVSPETDGLFQGAKLLITEKDLRESNWYSLKEYRAESVKAASKDVPSADGLITQKGLKKSYKWGKMLNLWNLVQKKNEGKSNDPEKHINGNTVDLPRPEAFPEKLKEANGGANPDVSQKLIRSYTVSSKNSHSLAGFSDNVSSIGTNNNALKRKEDVILQKNRSIKCSPSDLDNSLLHFYLASPMHSRRNSCGNR